MPIYMVYLFAGPYLWTAQVIAVVLLGALAWRAPGGALPAALTGQSAAGIAAAIASAFTVLMAPVALMIALRRHNREFPTRWTDPPGIACMVQVALLLAAGVNAAMVQRAR
jgi:hypothetical protein